MSSGGLTSSNRSSSSNSKGISGKSTNSSNFFYTNATSLVNKWSYFNSLIFFHNFPHVILVTETWFNALSISQLNNCKIFCKNRETIRRGGVAIYLRCDLMCFDASDTKSEQVCCNIDDESLIVGCNYRPFFADCGIDSKINRSIDYASHLCESILKTLKKTN